MDRLIISRIFLHLDGRDVRNFALVCKMWHDVSKMDSLWKFKFSRDYFEHSQLFETQCIECYRKIYIDLHTKGAFFTLVTGDEGFGDEKGIINKVMYIDYHPELLNGIWVEFPKEPVFALVSRKRFNLWSRKRSFYSAIDTVSPPPGKYENNIRILLQTEHLGDEAYVSEGDRKRDDMIDLRNPKLFVKLYEKRVYERTFTIDAISTSIE